MSRKTSKEDSDLGSGCVILILVLVALAVVVLFITTLGWYTLIPIVLSVVLYLLLDRKYFWNPPNTRNTTIGSGLVTLGVVCLIRGLVGSKLDPFSSVFLVVVLVASIPVGLTFLLLGLIKERQYTQEILGDLTLNPTKEPYPTDTTIQSNNFPKPRVELPSDWKTELRDEIHTFSPNWIPRERHGETYLKYGKTRMKLLGGENGTNGNLAYYLKGKGFDTRTETTLKGGRRADLVINQSLVIECKEHLTSKRTLWGLEREIQDQKKFNPHIVWALIYGDIKNEYYNQLCKEFGKDTIIVKGEVLSSRFDREEDTE